MADKSQLGRLAMRVEGRNWTAYYTMPDTMDGAIYLGQIAMKFVESPARKNAFMALMRDAVSDLIEEQTGVRPVWPAGPQSAPEHEKAGRA